MKSLGNFLKRQTPHKFNKNNMVAGLKWVNCHLSLVSRIELSDYCYVHEFCKVYLPGPLVIHKENMII